MEDKKQKIERKAEKQVEKEIAGAEKQVAKEITKIEDKVEKEKIDQTKANKEIKKEVKEVVEEASKDIKEIKEKAEEQVEKEEKKKKEEGKKEERKEEKKKKPEEKKKTEAIVHGKDLPVSTKQCIAICNSIRNKTIDKSISLLGEVLKMKRAIPMKGELPHRKGKIMSGRYPIKAAQHFIKLLKQLSANATVNEIEKGRIQCKANRASRPYKRFGNKRFKRTHVTLILKTWQEKK